MGRTTVDFEQLVFVCWDDQKSQNGCTPQKALKARDSHQFPPSKCAVSTQDGLLLGTPFWNIVNTSIVLYKSLTMDPSDASKYLQVETYWPIYGQLGTPQILWLMTPLDGAKHVPAKLLWPSSGLRFQMISGFQTWVTWTLKLYVFCVFKYLWKLKQWYTTQQKSSGFQTCRCWPQNMIPFWRISHTQHEKKMMGTRWPSIRILLASICFVWDFKNTLSTKKEDAKQKSDHNKE